VCSLKEKKKKHVCAQKSRENLRTHMTHIREQKLVRRFQLSCRSVATNPLHDHGSENQSDRSRHRARGSRLSHGRQGRERPAKFDSANPPSKNTPVRAASPAHGATTYSPSSALVFLGACSMKIYCVPKCVWVLAPPRSFRSENK
jgi:hypothetical protein